MSQTRLGSASAPTEVALRSERPFRNDQSSRHLRRGQQPRILTQLPLGGATGGYSLVGGETLAPASSSGLRPVASFDGPLAGTVPAKFVSVLVTGHPAATNPGKEFRGSESLAEPLGSQPRRLLQDDPALWRDRSRAQATVAADLLGFESGQDGSVFNEHKSDEAGYDESDPSPSMQVSDLLKASPLTAIGGRAKLEERIEALVRTGSKMGASGASSKAGSSAKCSELDAVDRARLAAAIADETLSSEQLRDSVSTALMDGFRKNTGKGTFGLLYELNAAQLLVQVAGRLRRYSSKADAGDVLQEVFFNVYRYPHRFDSTRDDAFRVWTAMIVRNTVLKHLRSRSTGGGNRREIPFEDLSDQPVAHSETPLSGALQNEANLECSRAYVVYLQLYIEFYTMLSERERRALHLVEVDGVSYREAAASLGIKLENLKMVIFRARKKIHRAMRRVFDGLSPDCKPARVGTPQGTPGGDRERLGPLN